MTQDIYITKGILRTHVTLSYLMTDILDEIKTKENFKGISSSSPGH